MAAEKAQRQREQVKVAVLFDQFGPYHQARLRSVAKKLEILAVEICGESLEYAWDHVETGNDFRRVTLFPNRNSGEVTARECHERIFVVLDEHLPSAVAVPGWATPAALSALDWCAQRGKLAIIMSESTPWDEPRKWWKEAIKRCLVSGYAAGGLVGGPPHAKYLEDLGVPASWTFLGYDVVDNHYFARASNQARAQSKSLRNELGLPPRYFLASARFIAKKNLSRLMEAFARYRRQANTPLPWALVVLGDGPLREQLLRQCENLGINEHVSWPGFIQYGDLPAYYGLAGGFIHASTTEQWGLVVNEAMACGLPVLVSDRCGCASSLVVERENGWTFDPEDVTTIADAMVRLANRSETELAAMGQCSRARLETEWSPEAFGEGLYRAVVTADEIAPRKPNLPARVLLRALMLRL